MKYATLLFLLLLPTIITAQTGGVVLSFSLKGSSMPIIEPIEIEVWQDSSFFRKDTLLGLQILRDLPIGTIHFKCIYQGTNIVQNKAIQIQTGQLIYASFSVDTSFVAHQENIGRSFDWSSSIGTDLTQDQIRNISLTPSEVMFPSVNFYIDGNSLRNLQCVTVVAYQVPLINRYGGASGARITRQDLARLPMRNPLSVIGTVGGVYNQEQSANSYIRGGRSDANGYYLDGMRVKSLDGVPNLYIESITVYTGGTPANYGDFTGGIVSVESVNTRRKYTRNFRNSTRQTSSCSMTSRSNEAPILNELNFDHFSEIYENDFRSPIEHPNSTFAIDVDQASWTYIKTHFKNAQIINRDAVKLEEMINSFKQKHVQIDKNELIGVEIERNNCSWNSESELVTIRLRAKDLPTDLPRISHNIVLLVDVSGSMTSSNKLPLLVQGMKEFVNSLTAKDRISIVAYAGSSGVVLEPTDCSHKDKIIAALDGLQSGGSTNGIGGIRTAYELAEQYYSPQLNNRIILATDGDFNVGINSTSELKQYVLTKRGKGIYLTVLGFGMGNYKNSILETLADNGDGNHFYINNIQECRKVLMENLGNIINLARDVKLNIEFNPRLVREYRLIGYENRLLPAKDFDNDLADGGEMGYGHTVTAVYEIKLGKESKQKTHFTKTTTDFVTNELAFVKLRYKPLEDSLSIQRKFSLKKNTELIEAPLINLIVSFGLHLRNSVFKGTISDEMIIAQAKEFEAKNQDERELREMILSLKKRL